MSNMRERCRTAEKNRSAPARMVIRSLMNMRSAAIVKSSGILINSAPRKWRQEKQPRKKRQSLPGKQRGNQLFTLLKKTVKKLLQNLSKSRIQNQLLTTSHPDGQRTYQPRNLFKKTKADAASREIPVSSDSSATEPLKKKGTCFRKEGR